MSKVPKKSRRLTSGSAWPSSVERRSVKGAPKGPSPHLSWAELAASDGTPYPPAWLDRALVLGREFEAIRRACGGKPIAVSSGFRTHATNKAAKGKSNSQHLFGRALDLLPPEKIPYSVFYEKCLTVARSRGIIRGIGKNVINGHVHIDTRPSDILVLWDE